MLEFIITYFLTFVIPCQMKIHTNFNNKFIEFIGRIDYN